MTIRDPLMALETGTGLQFQDGKQRAAQLACIGAEPGRLPSLAMCQCDSKRSNKIFRVVALMLSCKVPRAELH